MARKRRLENSTHDKAVIRTSDGELYRLAGGEFRVPAGHTHRKKDFVYEMLAFRVKDGSPKWLLSSQLVEYVRDEWDGKNTVVPKELLPGRGWAHRCDVCHMGIYVP